MTKVSSRKSIESANNETELILRLKKLWVKEAKVINESVRNNLNCPKSIESFDQIQKYLLDAIDNLMIIVENSDEINANNRLKFRDKISPNMRILIIHYL